MESVIPLSWRLSGCFDESGTPRKPNTLWTPEAPGGSERRRAERKTSKDWPTRVPHRQRRPDSAICRPLISKTPCRAGTVVYFSRIYTTGKSSRRPRAIRVACFGSPAKGYAQTLGTRRPLVQACTSLLSNLACEASPAEFSRPPCHDLRFYSLGWGWNRETRCFNA